MSVQLIIMAVEESMIVLKYIIIPKFHTIPMARTKRATVTVIAMSTLVLPLPSVEGEGVSVMVGFRVCVLDTTAVYSERRREYGGCVGVLV